MKSSDFLREVTHFRACERRTTFDGLFKSVTIQGGRLRVAHDGKLEKPGVRLWSSAPTVARSDPGQAAFEPLHLALFVLRSRALAQRPAKRAAAPAASCWKSWAFMRSATSDTVPFKGVAHREPAAPAGKLLLKSK